MIKEMSFEEMKPFWEKYVYPQRVKEGKRVKPAHIGVSDEFYFKVYRKLDVEKIIKTIKVNFLGFYINRKLIGGVSCYKTSQDYYRTRGGWTEPEYRRRGVMSELLLHTEKYASRENCKYVWSPCTPEMLQVVLGIGWEILWDSPSKKYGVYTYARKRI